jgi:hypothetical protein
MTLREFEVRAYSQCGALVAMKTFRAKSADRARDRMRMELCDMGRQPNRMRLVVSDCNEAPAANEEAHESKDLFA